MNGKMLLGIGLLIAGLAGIYLVLTGKLPPTSLSGTTQGGAGNSTTPATSTAGVTGSGTTIPGTTSGGTSPGTATQGQKPAGSGGISAASSLHSSLPFLQPARSINDIYLQGTGAFSR